MTIEITEKSNAEPKKVEPNDVTELMRAADTYEKIKELNDKIEAEQHRTVELMKAQQALGGRSEAGYPLREKTKEEVAQEEATALLKQFR